MSSEIISRIMVRNVVTLHRDEPVLKAVKLMKEKNIGSIVVVDEDMRIVGIFTERDLVRLVAEGKDLNIPLKDAMSKNLIVARENDSIISVASKMLEHWIRHMPVVNDNGKVIGIVSIRDVLRHILSSQTFP